MRGIEGMHMAPEEWAMNRSGKEHERRNIDVVPIDNDAYRAAEAEIERSDREGFHEFSAPEAFDLARKFQPADPENPNKDFIREVRIGVMEELDIPIEDSSQVKAYTAVGTPLDHMGVDAFLDIYDDVITVDLTVDNKDKSQSLSDIIDRGEIPDAKYKPEEEEFLARVDKLVQDICVTYREKSSLHRNGEYKRKMIRWTDKTRH